MPHSVLARVLRQLRRVPAQRGAETLTDGQLLERFASARDEAAFAALLDRHGRMVWNVCRRVLVNTTDADDAFQATFLVLVKKASAIAKQDSVGSWLHGVAYRIALDARGREVRRRALERQGATMAPQETSPDPLWNDVRPILDEELRRLPQKYSAPLVLCYLEGKTNDEAAGLLGWSRGTVAGRLSRARELLRGRLARRGLSLSSVILGSLLAENEASALVPGALIDTTLEASLSYGTAVAKASAGALTLAEGALHAMFMKRLRTMVLFLTAAMVALAGAGWFWQAAPAELPPTPPAPQPVSRPIILNDDPAQAKADRPTLVQGNTAFACDLYARLRESEGNIVFSPYSISTCLGMTYAGARGQTAEQMAKVLHFTLPQERLHPAAGALARDLARPPEDAKTKKPLYDIQIANALWGQKDFGFLKDFVDLTRTSYGAGLREVDFLHAREEARKTINEWVEKETRQKIKDLLQPKHLTEATRLVLTNAIYFKAEWETKFVRDYTRDRPFQIAGGKQVQVPTMAMLSVFNYHGGDTFQMLDLPFVGNMSMLVLLPRKADGLPELEKALTADNLSKWHGGLKQAKVSLQLPRFKITDALELKKVLSAMGMELAFDSGRADFSGMSREGPLFISEVVHKTLVDVNEEGTEAAGATAAAMSFGGVPGRDIIFHVDHPFLFLLRDNRSGSILFAGRVSDPVQK
jgi:serpin B